MAQNRPSFVVPLTHLALIQAAGPDAAAFLQGQLSNDVRKLGPTRAQLSSYNSAKGRMLAVLHLLRRDDTTFLLELDRGLVEPVLKRLKMFVLRSKLTLSELADHTLHGLAGPDAANVLSGLGLPAPAAALDCAWSDGICVTRRIGEVPRYTLLAPRGSGLEQRLAARAQAGTAEDWKRLEIEAGVPTVYPETQDHFVAQMCNLDTLGGISFDKGCYTGQEVIARVHYRGAVKRHMTMQLLEGSPPAPGTKLESGEVVDAVARPEGGTMALVVGST